MRSKSHCQSIRITITTTAQVQEYLRQLVSIGLYGTTVAEAAEQLVCEGLRNDLKRKRINTLEKTEQ